jgi:uncharacterized membrane protein
MALRLLDPENGGSARSLRRRSRGVPEVDLMRSRAAIGNHPLHPALVGLPVGAFFLAFVADVAFLQGGRPLWGEMAGVAIGVGVITALVAAVTGFIDYGGLLPGSVVRRIATVHMVLNLLFVALYAASFYLRYTHAVRFLPETPAIALAWIAFALMLASGWLGGKMVFELKAGVVEPHDAAAVKAEVRS